MGRSYTWPLLFLNENDLLMSMILHQTVAEVMPPPAAGYRESGAASSTCTARACSMTDVLLPWFAVQVRSNREERVREELERKSIDSYLPTYQEKRRWADRDKILDIPLFRGYVFARIEDQPEGRLEVLKISGAARIIGAVSEREIESVKLMLEAGARPHSGLNPLLKEGCKVRVKHGSLKGVEGIFDRRKGHGRLVLLIDMIGKAVSTEIDAGDVEVLA